VKIASMRKFSPEDLSRVLHYCGETLAEMYQGTLQQDVWSLSEAAFRARDYLLYEIQKQQINQYIH